MAEESTTPNLADRVRKSFDAANRRDFEAMVSPFAPDAVWEAPDLGISPTGTAAIRHFFEDWIGTFEEFTIEVEESLDLGNGVTIAVVCQSGRPAGSSGRVQWRFAAVATWVDGMIKHVTAPGDIEAGRAAAERLVESRR